MNDTQIPWRSADLSDRMLPIATRLPAGLTEAELFAAYPEQVAP